MPELIVAMTSFLEAAYNDRINTSSRDYKAVFIIIALYLCFSCVLHPLFMYFTARGKVLLEAY